VCPDRSSSSSVPKSGLSGSVSGKPKRAGKWSKKQTNASPASVLVDENKRLLEELQGERDAFREFKAAHTEEQLAKTEGERAAKAKADAEIEAAAAKKQESDRKEHEDLIYSMAAGLKIQYGKKFSYGVSYYAQLLVLQSSSAFLIYLMLSLVLRSQPSYASILELMISGQFTRLHGWRLLRVQQTDPWVLENFGWLYFLSVLLVVAHFLMRAFVIWWVGGSNVTYKFKRIVPNHDNATDERPQSMAQGKLVYMKAFSTQFISTVAYWEPLAFAPTWDVTDIDVSFELFMPVQSA
jgi:hypothetical protein